MFRFVCHLMRKKAVKKFPESNYSVIGGFFFLRFLCPAIVTPERYGIATSKQHHLQPTHLIQHSSLPPQRSLMFTITGISDRRPFVLVSKVLQTIANGVEFGKKEPFMLPMNTHIQQYIKNVHAFFDELAVTLSLSVSSPFLSLSRSRSLFLFFSLSLFLFLSFSSLSQCHLLTHYTLAESRWIR